ncbi:MAG: hypothetical protein AMXMBFR59_28270 [Rhodanobacteraceae bacterium]
MTTDRYWNAAQQRVLRTLRLLNNLGATGASPSDIAAGVGTLRSNTTRDLANLRTAGLATAANGRWYASPSAAANVTNPSSTTAESQAGHAAIIPTQASLVRCSLLSPQRDRVSVA